MMHTKTDSDDKSYGLSSQGSPKIPVVYVSSSPSKSSGAYHSRDSSASTRISGSHNPTFGDKANRKLVEKGLPHSKVIDEEKDAYDEYSWKTKIFIAIIGFLLFFSFIIWAASLCFKPQLTVKSLAVHNFNLGVGSDRTGVPTYMLTMNSSVRMTMHNPATFFDIYVSSNSMNLMYSQLTVATGELKKYRQPRKSLRAFTINLQGRMVALYGAGPSLNTDLVDNGKIPMRLVFEVNSCGDVIGKLVRTKHTHHVSCLVVVDSHSDKAIKLEENACSYF